MKARTITIGASLVVHALVGVLAIYYVGGAHKAKHDSIAIMGEKKKPKEEAKKEPPPPPRVRPKAVSTEPVTKAEPPPKAEPAPKAPRASLPHVAAPMSNAQEPSGGSKGAGSGSGGGNGSGSGTGDGNGNGSGGAPKVAVAKANKEAPCTEQPTKAQPVSRPTEIEYTQAARQDGIEGRLVLKVVVGADGAVNDVLVVSSVDPALDAAAIAAVKTWVFKPAMRCGKPMAGGTYTLAQRFELGD